VPSLGFHIWEGLVTPEDVGKLTMGSVIHHRFNIVLSIRYNNLRILLNRPRLESFLEEFWHSSDISNDDRKVTLPLDLASVQNCVESSTAIISMVHSITTCGSQYCRLLGAWNYSLYYSESGYMRIKSMFYRDETILTLFKLLMLRWSLLGVLWQLRRSEKIALWHGAWWMGLEYILTKRSKRCVNLMLVIE
jgi:hypothetical protein